MHVLVALADWLPRDIAQLTVRERKYWARWMTVRAERRRNL
jgi:hypothetical protein